MTQSGSGTLDLDTRLWQSRGQIHEWPERKLSNRKLCKWKGLPLKRLRVKLSQLDWFQDTKSQTSCFNFTFKAMLLEDWNSEFGSLILSPIRRKTTTLNMDSKVGMTTPKNVDSFLGCRCWPVRFRTFPGCCSVPWPSRADLCSDSLTLAERR